MKQLCTLPYPVQHKITVTSDAKRWDAFEDMCRQLDEEFRKDYITSHLPLLKELNPALLGMMVCGNYVILQFCDSIRYVNTESLTDTDITKKLFSQVQI